MKKTVDLKKKIISKSFFSNNYSYIGLIVVVILFEFLTEGLLLGSKNLMNIFNNFFSIGIGALGLLFVMSLGELDLSVGAILGFAAMVGSYAADINLWLVLPACLLAGVFIGLLNGVVVSKLKVESFIETLAMSFVVRGFTTFLLNGARGVDISMRIFDGSAIKITTFIVITFLCFILFTYTSFGKNVRAVGSVEEAARQSGVKTKKVKIIAFVICGLLCGLVGFFSLIRACTVTTKTGNAYEFETLLAIVFGGMPLTGGWPVKFRAAVIGSVSMAVIFSGMSLMGLSGLTQQVIEGILLIGVVTLSFDRKNVAVIK